jgi:hypothetical protein
VQRCADAGFLVLVAATAAQFTILPGFAPS